MVLVGGVSCPKVLRSRDKSKGPSLGSFPTLKKIKIKTMQILVCRKKRPSRKLIGERLRSEMADHEQKAVTADVTSGDMSFQPILEDGVFRFDCSANDRNAAYPTLSFVNSKDRETPIMSNTAPLYIPTFECLFGKQIVKIEVSHFIAFLNLVFHIAFISFQVQF